MGRLSDEIRRLSGDPGVRRLAEVVEAMQIRLDTCCPPAAPLAPTVAPPDSKNKDT